jgi:hypothetical protein
MSRLLRYLLLLTLAPAAQAQSANPAVWCPPGATWTYGYSLFSAQGTLTVRYVRDTLVAGQPAQLLTRQLVSYSNTGPVIVPPSTYSMPSVVTRVSASRVEVQANGQFFTLYDFAAPVGSSWLTPRVVPYGPCSTEQVRVIIDSVGTQQVGGRSLRWFRAHLTTPAGAPALGQWLGRIYEQLGNVGQYMQPQSPVCAGTDPGYMGSLTGFRATGWPSVTYNAATGILLHTAQARAHAAGFRIYPNPSASFVTLELPSPPEPGACLRLLDLTGRVVRQATVPANRRVDVRGLPQGSYTLLLLAAGQPPLAQRLVIE